MLIPDRLLLLSASFFSLLIGTTEVFAHAVTEGDKGYMQEISGVNLLPFVYLGAKQMMTGYDHILFLFGVIFFLYRASHIGLYVSLFVLGHSTTMLLGVRPVRRECHPANTRRLHRHQEGDLDHLS